METVRHETITPLSKIQHPLRKVGRAAARSIETRRRRGRPMELAPEEVLERIRRLARRPDGLFRVSRERPALYARARRQFGRWEGAVRSAGLDYSGVVAHARRGAVKPRPGDGRRAADAR